MLMFFTIRLLQQSESTSCITPQRKSYSTALLVFSSCISMEHGKQVWLCVSLPELLLYWISLNESSRLEEHGFPMGCIPATSVCLEATEELAKQLEPDCCMSDSKSIYSYTVHSIWSGLEFYSPRTVCITGQGLFA